MDLADGDLEPEKRVLRYARKDSVLFQMQVLLIDAQGTLLWEEPPHSRPKLGERFDAAPWFHGVASGSQAVVSDSGDMLRIAVPILRQERFSGALVAWITRSLAARLALPRCAARSHSFGERGGPVPGRQGALRARGEQARLALLPASAAARRALAGLAGKEWADDPAGRGLALRLRAHSGDALGAGAA